MGATWNDQKYLNGVTWNDQNYLKLPKNSTKE